MTAVRSKAQVPVGSLQWINDENDQLAQFCAHEIEDFAFSARNEVEWLNEHMAEIFSKGQVNVTDIFKTPGKLRGKTPRTARKRNPLEAREPLTDSFSSNVRTNGTPLRRSSPFQVAPSFQVAEDVVVPAAVKKPLKSNTDSGHHGLTEDQMGIDERASGAGSSADSHAIGEQFPPSLLDEVPNPTGDSEGRSTAETSFQTAKEEITKRDILKSSPQREVQPPQYADSVSQLPHTAFGTSSASAGDEGIDNMDVDIDDKKLNEGLDVDASRSPSQASSPARSILRKSSLTFAALPAREPLTTKKSLGARVSRTSNLDQAKAPANRGSFLGRFTGGKSLGGYRQPDAGHDAEKHGDEEVYMDKPGLAREDSEDSKITKLHNKSSTQRLHERINMLGKSQPPRPTKSIPAAAPTANPAYPELPTEPAASALQQAAILALKSTSADTPHEEDDDDWIQPPQPQTTSRQQLSKSVSADVMEKIRGKQKIGGQDSGVVCGGTHAPKKPSPTGQDSVSQLNRPQLSRAISSDSPASVRQVASKDTNEGIVLLRAETANINASSTTPVGSPLSKRYVDGPLSASKSKLQSIMKTARGLFSSSAGVSAQAKMETLSPPSMRLNEEAQPVPTDGVLRPNLGESRKSTSPVDIAAGRKTRSSTEKEERRKKSEAKERQRLAAENERPRRDHKGEASHDQTQVKEPVRPTRQSPRKPQTNKARISQSKVTDNDAPSHAQGQPSQAQKPKDVRRPIKPAREAAHKPKPQPVAIRVGFPSQGIRMNNAALSSSLQESLPPPQAKQLAMTKKPSNASIHSATSTNNLKGSVTSAATKPKALIAAEKKKEQDERETQRKLEQKRDIERRRAAQQEESRRKEQLQRQEAERQRERERSAVAEDPKNIAKRQLIEKRRLDMQNKDQHRAPQRPGLDHGTVVHQSQTSVSSRPELGGSRPPSRLQNAPDVHRTLNHHGMQNPAKPGIKRVFDPDAEDEPFRPVRPPGGSAYQSNDSKRRKTGDEDTQEVRVRPTMAPPIRQSAIRPGGPKASIFANNYAPAPPPASHNHNGPPLLKSTTANQAYQQHAHPHQVSRPGHHPDIAKYQNGKIPFAEAPNPPPTKTPTSRPGLVPAKSSPQYQHGENIHLDDIPTESEDESDSDSGGAKPKPSNIAAWAQSPLIRETLIAQEENMDADAVFGPIQSPHMEEMFRERHHRFRSRTSSANWAGADRLTEEEIRRDVEARQRLRREGVLCALRID